MKAQLPYGWDDTGFVAISLWYLKIKTFLLFYHLGYHPDHQTTGKLVRDTLLGFEASTASEYDELSDAGLAPWDVTQYWMFALTLPEMTHYVQLNSEMFQKKVNAYALHVSQVQGDTAQLRTNVAWIAGQIGNATGVVALAEGYTAYF